MLGFLKILYVVTMVALSSPLEANYESLPPVGQYTFLKMVSGDYNELHYASDSNKYGLEEGKSYIIMENSVYVVNYIPSEKVIRYNKVD